MNLRLKQRLKNWQGWKNVEVSFDNGIYLMLNAREIATLKIVTKRKKAHDGDDSAFMDVIMELFVIVQAEILKMEISKEMLWKKYQKFVTQLMLQQQKGDMKIQFVSCFFSFYFSLSLSINSFSIQITIKNIFAE